MTIRRKVEGPQVPPVSRVALAWISMIVLGSVLGLTGCRSGDRRQAEQASVKSTSSASSSVAVTVKPGGPVVITTSTAEFDVLPSGYIQSFLLKDGKRLTLDEPDTGSLTHSDSGDSIFSDGWEIRDLTPVGQPELSEAQGKIGTRGKRVRLTFRSNRGIEKNFAVEVYDDFPAVAFTTAAYQNIGTADIKLSEVITQRHRLNASLADPQARPYDLWSFQGSSYAWGRDNVLRISQKFSQHNVMGAMTKGGEGGGIPVDAFWTATVGEAIAHVETLPLVLSMPVTVSDGTDGRVQASIVLEPNTTLKPGEVFSTPLTFVAVYSGDYYEPLRLYSSVLQREGWRLPKPNGEDYNISWCGWGYESEVTPAQMLGTIPKLREFNIKWATLDDRWFNNYGDWEPRPDTFSGNAIKKMVDGFHQQGIHVQLWWLPIAVEDGQGKYESHRYGVAEVVKHHPEWLILNKNGKHAHMVRGLAALCPAVPEVQEYYKKLTEKFVREWGFDGHKLDNVYTVPTCYNPKHHHKSPQDSINAMGEVYKVIFQTTRALKPESVTQACPCGTPPNLAWLPYLDQAVTADPVGSVQVRQRIKMYKALLGPQAAVYGDHVELTAIRNEGNTEIDYGRDFASTVGTGGVVGTKFVWPDAGPHFKTVLLTSEKEAHWKKWIDLYNSKMLSRGTFRNLYVTGYDVPEGYAIEKGGKMYYAFFTPDPEKPWKGELELRGLTPGKYHVADYENGKDMGTVDSQSPKITAEFTHHLLLEAGR